LKELKNPLIPMLVEIGDHVDSLALGYDGMVDGMNCY